MGCNSADPDFFYLLSFLHSVKFIHAKHAILGFSTSVGSLLLCLFDAAAIFAATAAPAPPLHTEKVAGSNPGLAKLELACFSHVYVVS